MSHKEKSMEDVIRHDGRYPLAAYAFLHEGLARAVKQVHGKDAPPTAQRHVTGRQLCLALREQAVERWGLLSRTVLSRWNIHGTIDFGQMVYMLIQHGFMRKTEEDSLEDFRNVFTFDELATCQEFELKE